MKSILFLALFPCLLVAQETPLPSRPFILGQTLTLPSSILSEPRTIHIYLPEGFSPDSAATYPVIYLLDGSADEDFIHIVGLVQFANFPWVHSLPKSIVVGIANVDRERDFTYPTSIAADKKKFPTTGGSEKFIAFIEKELQPYIRKHYPTNGSEMLIGQSLGGLLATEILYKKPLLFDQYLIVSPSLWWDQESLLSHKAAIASPDFQQATQIYIAVGKEGKVMESDARTLYRQLKGLKKPNVQVHFEYFPKDSHANILHMAVYQAFLILGKR